MNAFFELVAASGLHLNVGGLLKGFRAGLLYQASCLQQVKGSPFTLISHRACLFHEWMKKRPRSDSKLPQIGISPQEVSIGAWSKS